MLRSIGTLTRTGHESDPDVHLAMNIGLPLADPGGGFYFVFMTGVPKFQKYDAKGTLLFERHIEGVELDAHVQSLPTTWPRRDRAEGVGLPLVVAARARGGSRSCRPAVGVAGAALHVRLRRRTATSSGRCSSTAPGPIAVTSLTFAKGDRCW